ncbi:hypothetical protein [Nonomuraea dietziae]
MITEARPLTYAEAATLPRAAVTAYRHHASGEAFGKVVIAVKGG